MFSTKNASDIPEVTVRKTRNGFLLNRPNDPSRMVSYGPYVFNTLFELYQFLEREGFGAVDEIT